MGSVGNLVKAKSEKVSRTVKKPVVLLIGGGPRCGTTLMVDLLNENSGIGILSEYVFDDLVRIFIPLFERERVITEMALPDLEELKGAGARSPRKRGRSTSYIFRQNLSLNYPRRFPTRADFPRMLSVLMGMFLGKEPVAVVGAKDPFFTLHHDRGFVDRSIGVPVRYVLLIRSPLSQINSSLNRRNLAHEGRDVWHIHTVEDAIHEYRSMCLLNYSYLIHHSNDAVLIKYEDLVDDPRRELKRVYKLCGIAGAPEMGGVTFDYAPADILTEAERQAVEDAFGAAERGWRQRSIADTSDVAGIFEGLLEEHPVPFELSLRPGIPGRPLLGLGWKDGFGPDGARSRDEYAYLIFAVQNEGHCSIQLTLAPVFGPQTDIIDCAVSFDGERMCELRWIKDEASAASAVIRAGETEGLTVLYGSAARTIEVGRVPLTAKVPHSVRLSFSPDSGVSLSRFALA